MGLYLLAGETLAILNTKVSEVMLTQGPFSQTLPSLGPHLALAEGFTRLLNLDHYRAVCWNCCPHSNILETWCFSSVCDFRNVLKLKNVFMMQGVGFLSTLNTEKW